ncbi:ribose/galactose ABC transporter permease [Spiroplasma helicoides]|uniref:Ribose/galactose ABC transporter permease n=1 Tax=Spiroplasma helicoides TaxID=216938 RepID=A0A1B3SKW4_9MOLU|nr:hypothetical protein [Spiroplasma helicoides]AOG60579.1 ribose/galactose ABC transporter permease [Spiroplasma helicoides]
MKFNLKQWTFKQKVYLSLKSNETKNKLKYAKASIIAILIGFIVGFIVVYLAGGDGVQYMQALFTSAFSNFTAGGVSASQLSVTLNYFVVFALMGLGLALGFKVGLFNMGGSGQAVFGFGMAYLALLSITKEKNISMSEIGSGYIFILFIIFILSGVTISLIAGILKVFLNIHEVVTTIMLNWIVWYMVKFFINQTNTNFIEQSFLAVGGYNWLGGLIAVVLSFASVWFVLTFTTYGYKFRIIGKQPSAGKYAGINSRLYIVITTAFQGLFISMGGFFYYFTIARQLNYYADVIPTIGFDAICVALVAFNNVLGILPVAWVWAILNSGAISAASWGLVAKETSYLIFGVIIYSATIYSLLFRFVPFKWAKFWNYFVRDTKLKLYVKSINSQIKDLKKSKRNIKNEQAIILAKEELIKFKQENKNNKDSNFSLKYKNLKLNFEDLNDQYRGKYHKQIIELKEMRTEAIDKGFENYYNRNLSGVKQTYNNAKVLNIIGILNTAITDLNEVDKLLFDYNSNFKEQIKQDKSAKSELTNKKKDYKNNLIQKINSNYQEKIKEINNINKNYTAQYKQNKILLKEELKQIKLDLNNKIKLEKDKVKKNELLIEKYNKILEVNDKYVFSGK